MTDPNVPAGIAALTICEALLLALNDAKILPEREILGLLTDAATTHENAANGGISAETHKAAADLIKRIITKGNAARHP